jgi:gliding motility-associated-like protein
MSFHSYQEAGQYTVSLTAYNAAGCSSLYILGVFNIIPDGAIYIPNAFTPNDDGNNDDFKAVGLGVSEFRMTIFDRWGKEIKTMNALAETWDGTSKGQDAPEGTYTYLVYYRLNSGAEKKMAGTIILVR